MKTIRGEVETNGVRIHYTRSGQGNPVLLLHGFPGGAYSWDKVVRILQQTHTVIVPDARGFGESDKPLHGYDAMTMVEDFRGLLRHMDIGPVHVVAHGISAPPALVWAGTHPEEVRTLAYLDHPIITGPCLRQLSIFSEQSTIRGGCWWWPLAMAPELAEILFAGHERELISWFHRYYCANPRILDPALTARMVDSFSAPGGAIGVLGIHRALFETSAQTEPFMHRRIKVPALAIGGDESFGRLTYEMLATVAEDVRGEVLTHCGHFIPEEQPLELVDRLIKFWRSTARVDRLRSNRRQTTVDAAPLMRRHDGQHCLHTLSSITG